MRLASLALAALVTLALAAPARAGDAVIPLSQVGKGMRCAGYTVLQGTEISVFTVDVIDVVAGTTGQDPRILVRVSGPAVELSGIAEGVSGAPIYCPDGTGGTGVVGAISETVGQFGEKIGLATPIEQVLGESPAPPAAARRDPQLLASGREVRGPLTVAGLSSPVAQAVVAAGKRARQRVLVSPPGPLGSFPPQELRPGASVSAGLSSGDLAIGAVGTVTYADGPRVWVFGHPFENSGRRSLLLQDAYVYQTIDNPIDLEEATSYKLAAPGHDLGMVTNDAPNAVVGETGALPPTIPLRVAGRDLTTGRVGFTDVKVADEAKVNLPSGTSPLGLVGQLAIAQASTSVLRAAPANQSGTMCLRVAFRELPQPVRLCNRYVVQGGPAAPETGGINGATGAMLSDFDQVVALIDAVNFRPPHVTAVDVSLRLAAGLDQAYIVRGSAPRRVRRGQRIRVTLLVRRVRGRLERRSFRMRVPSSARTGRNVLEINGTGPDLGGEAGATEVVIEVSEELGGTPEELAGDAGPQSVEELAAQISALARYDGVAANFARKKKKRKRARSAQTEEELVEEETAAEEPGGKPVFRDPRLRIGGTTEIPIVVRE